MASIEGYVKYRRVRRATFSTHPFGTTKGIEGIDSRPPAYNGAVSISRRAFLTASAASLLPAQAPPRPNILLIVADDLSNTVWRVTPVRDARD